jgi:hypothetical protein
MSLESVYFKRDYQYKAKFVNKCIAIIRFTKSEKRRKAYRNLVFKMMKDIVKKNIANYLNLLSSIDMKDTLPTRDELIADCYIIFDKCVEKFILGKDYNFYFYFNKSLSRNFFRDYQKELQHNNSVEITEALATVNSGFHDYHQLDTTELLMEHLGLNELEIRICRSRMLGQKTSEFLSENEDVTNAQYSKRLKRIKEVLIEFQENGEI